ncbi:MAG: leucine-rich repeat domain-containing protein [Bacilli bacterium]
MGNKFLRLFLIVISSFAASVGLASCSVIIPGNTLTTSDSSTGPHSHNYNKQVIKDAYKVSNADCEHAATYYYSCSCGDIGIETFEFGSPLGHDWHYEYLQTSEGEYYQSGTCSRCDAKEKRTIQSVNNLSFSVISEEEKTCQVTGFKKFYYDERDNNIFIPKMWNDYKVTSISEYAFYGCYSLRSIVIPDSVTSIGTNAFVGCTSLRSIVIPDSVASIGDYAFNGCDFLSSIIVKEGNTVYDSRKDCNAIIETSTNTLIAGCADTIIPDSVTSIGGGAFSDCTSLSSVTIGNGVTSIGELAFKGCLCLSSIVISDSVTSIGEGAFVGCTSLRSILIPNSVTSIGGGAFGDCTSLSSVTIGNGVTTIGSSAFNNCYSLNSIVIPDSVTTIDSSAFWNCNSLSDVYYIGSEEQWNAIYIGSDNDELKSATIHYNYMG